MAEKRRLWVAAFILAAIAGAVLVFLFLRDKQLPEEEKMSTAAEESDDLGMINEDDRHEGMGIQDPVMDIPPDRRAVSIPVSFFGDSPLLHEGGRVDIVSTYYDRETGILDSEKIICGEEIIRLEPAGGSGQDSSITFLEDTVLREDISGRGSTGGYRNMLVLTFFLTDEEVLASFTALERGMLYVAVCPVHIEIGRGY